MTFPESIRMFPDLGPDEFLNCIQAPLKQAADQALRRPGRGRAKLPNLSQLLRGRSRPAALLLRSYRAVRRNGQAGGEQREPSASFGASGRSNPRLCEPEYSLDLITGSGRCMAMRKALLILSIT